MIIGTSHSLIHQNVPSQPNSCRTAFGYPIKILSTDRVTEVSCIIFSWVVSPSYQKAHVWLTMMQATR
ncbi:hypothetical protein OPV22_008971 [Ensete ventricosum]|uniref:Uncharacterized protein n=1 Tax=Ensete ventricosum TaxID=4639 RepID=A0AAV8RFW5_ENSVE|nr:hypothetical protein OPV22_008971 [Ensete ventricosum]